jgi:hypothetical protein
MQQDREPVARAKPRREQAAGGSFDAFGKRGASEDLGADRQPGCMPEAGASGAHERQQVGGSSHPKAGSGRPRQKGTVPLRIAPPETNRGPA